MACPRIGMTAEVRISLCPVRAVCILLPGGNDCTVLLFFITDITEIPCSNAKLYLAPVFDCYDGAIVGYHMDTSRPAELCCTAVENACKKTGASGMILHSDRGSQYTSGIFRECLKKHGAIQSMSGTGRCYDNARMESFFRYTEKGEAVQNGYDEK